MDALSDDEFLARFEAATLEPFHHRDHVRMTWLYLRAHDDDTAARKVADGIRNFATAHGKTAMFHVTLTRAWLRLVRAALGATPGASFADFAGAHAHLLDKDCIYHHYRKETVLAEKARMEWVEPDLQPLPDGG
jgi:hypothetical protein